MDCKKVRLLIAEDDYLVAEAIKRLLRHSEYEIIGEASNGEEAVKLTGTLKPDLVLMDLKMPVMNGLEATRQINQKHPTPVVILTAHDSAEIIEQAAEMGAGAFLTKPPKKQEINRAIIIAIARHQDLLRLQKLNQKLAAAAAEINTLRAILPLCSFCKKVRDDQGYWSQVEVYIRDHVGIDFSHGICPSCLQKNYPDIAEKM